MNFNVGMAYGFNFLFSFKCARPYAKLTIEPERITLAGVFKIMYFDPQQITDLPDYKLPWWVFTEGIRITHSEKRYFPFIVIWSSDVSEIKSSLIDNGFLCK